MGIQINGQTDTVTAIDGSLNVGGDVTIPGVLTYDDVTNVDSIGVVTARDGLHVTGGNLGINTFTPSTPLEIYTASSAAWKFRINSDVSDGAGFYQRSNGDFEMVLRDASNNNNYIAGTSGALQFASSGSEKLRITSGGRLGVGLENPNSNLHVKGGSESTDNLLLTLQSSGVANDGSLSTGLRLINSTSDTSIHGADIRAIRTGGSSADLTFSLYNGNSPQEERLRITSDGRIGIGTDNPDQAVEINGTVKFTRGTSTEGSQMLVLPLEDITLASNASASIPVGSRFTGMIIVAGYSNDTPGGVWAVASASAYDVDAVTRLQFKNHPASNISDLTITSPSVGGTHQFQLNQTGSSTKTYKLFAMGIYG